MPLDAWFAAQLPALTAHPAFDTLMVLASTAGLVLLAVGLPWWLLRRDRALGWAAIGALLAGLGSALVLQLLVQRPRPELAGALLPLPPLPSFPSGHAVLVATSVVVLIAHRWRLGLALLPLAILVAVSRVHVGHHYFTDVVGGTMLGVGLGLGAVVRARSDRDDPWRLRWVLWPQMGLVATITLAAYTGALARGGHLWLSIPGSDKVLHFLLFGLLAFGVHFATRGRTLRVLGQRLPLAVLVPLLGAATEELAQSMSPHRTMDGFDLLADLLGLLVFHQIARRLSSPVAPSWG